MICQSKVLNSEILVVELRNTNRARFIELFAAILCLRYSRFPLLKTLIAIFYHGTKFFLHFMKLNSRVLSVLFGCFKLPIYVVNVIFCSGQFQFQILNKRNQPLLSYERTKWMSLQIILTLIVMSSWWVYFSKMVWSSVWDSTIFSITFTNFSSSSYKRSSRSKSFFCSANFFCKNIRDVTTMLASQSIKIFKPCGIRHFS